MPRAPCRYSAENTATKQNTTLESDPAMTTASKARLRNRSSETSGDFTRFSIATNSASSAMPAASMPIVFRDVHPHASPRSNARLMQTRPPVTASMPGKSMWRSAFSSRDSFT